MQTVTTLMLKYTTEAQKAIAVKLCKIAAQVASCHIDYTTEAQIESLERVIEDTLRDAVGTGLIKQSDRNDLDPLMFTCRSNWVPIYIDLQNAKCEKVVLK